MKRIKWGIISTGAIANVFADTVEKMNDDVVIHGVASRNIESAKRFAEKYNIAETYDDYEKLAADDNIDVVYIGTPHNMHYENMMMCLRRGKHVVCEKPFTVTAKEAAEVYAFAKEKNLFVMEAFWTKFLPLYREVEKIIAEDVIGDVRILTAQYGYRTGAERALRKFNPNLAGGALLDIGVYAIGFAAMILGYFPKRIEASAAINSVGTDDYNSILLEYENGKIAQLTTAIQTEIPVMGCIYGSLGYIQIKNFKNPQIMDVVLNNGESYQVERRFDVNGFEYEIREAMRCISNGRQHTEILTPEQSIAVMDIMDNVRRLCGIRFPFEALGGFSEKKNGFENF